MDIDMPKNAIIEALRPEIAPFEDQVHSLLLDSVGKIADHWIEQLKLLRENADALERQIMNYVGKTKADISALHDLGTKVAAEAKRGQDVCQQLRESVERLAS
jgi:transcriptional regulator